MESYKGFSLFVSFCLSLSPSSQWKDQEFSLCSHFVSKHIDLDAVLYLIVRWINTHTHAHARLSVCALSHNEVADVDLLLHLGQSIPTLHTDTTVLAGIEIGSWEYKCYDSML